jgi:hypothetical protein
VAHGPEASDAEGTGAPSSLPLPISLPRLQIPLPKPQGRLPDAYSRSILAPPQARTGGSDIGAQVDAELAAAKSAVLAAAPSNRRLPQLPHLLLDIPTQSFLQLRPALGSSCSRGAASRGAARGGQRGAARRAALDCLARVARLWSRRDCDPWASAWRRACGGTGLRPAAEHPRGGFSYGAQAGLAAEHPRPRIPSPSSSSSASCLPTRVFLPVVTAWYTAVTAATAGYGNATQR